MEGSRWFEEASQATIEVRNGRRVVVKRFQAPIGVAKWFFLGASRTLYPLALTPEARMRREVEFFEDRHTRIRTPSIIEVDWESKVLVREYVDGHPLRPWSFEADAARLGEVLAGIHSEGWVLGDTKPSNFLETGENIYVVDAEQATRSSDPRLRAWDLLVAVIFLYLANLSTRTPGIRRIISVEDFELRVDLMLDNYVEAGGERKTLEYMSSPKKSPIILLLPANYISALRRVVKRRQRLAV